MRQFQCALITGATSGIGEAFALLLAEKKIPLLLTGRQQSKLQDLAASLKKDIPVETLAVDLSSFDERKKLLLWVSEKKPDLVVNNAGFGTYGNTIDASLDEQLQMIEVNCSSVVAITLHAAKVLKQAKKTGVILNISSIAGEIPMPGMSVYGASKAFVTSFSRAVATELEKMGIHVLVSCPGPVQTDFANRAAKKKEVYRQGHVIDVHYAAKELWWQIINCKEKHTFDRRSFLMIQITKHFAPLNWVKKAIWKRIQERI